MEKAQQAGYIVRARLSPIIPVQDWRNEYTELFEYLFACVQPDLVTLELLGWMDYQDLNSIFNIDLLNPAVVKSAEQAANELKNIPWGPFTEEVHEEIYRFCIETIQRISPKTPISICHGTDRVWTLLGSMMNMRPDNYLCNCGPDTAPGALLYHHWHP